MGRVMVETRVKTSTVQVQWRLVGGSQMYHGRLPSLTTRNLRAESPVGSLPKRGDRLMLPVSGFPDPIPFRCAAISTATDPQLGPVMTSELEIA